MSMLLFETNREFFIRSEDFVEQGVRTLCIDKKTTRITTLRDDTRLDRV
jgi:hypothetical protein